jgi:HNH endonuclease
MEVIERIERRLQVDMLSGCHVWTGATDRDGYGIMTITVTHPDTGQTRRVQRRVHRERWERTVGPIPPMYVIDHVQARGCCHRTCCNPAHLEPVTVTENSKRVKPWNSAKLTCPVGHAYDAENTLWSKGKDGYVRRGCKACTRARRAAKNGGNA